MLQSLNISNTAVRVLPESIGRPGMLRELQIEKTAVKVLPESIGKLSSLTRLNARRTRLSSLPDSIGGLGMLQWLGIDYTAVEVLPESIGGLRSLTYLHASDTRLSSLPDSIGGLGMLQSLWFSNTAVRVLPESIKHLKSLTHLWANNTLLSSLSDSIGCLQDLQSLQVAHTRLTCLPESIGDLDKLSHLFLDSTPLEALPDSCWALRGLSWLTLKDTQIRAFPEAFRPREWVELTFSATVNNDRHLSSGAVSTILGSAEDLCCSVDVHCYIKEGSNDIENGLVPEEGQTPAMKLTFPVNRLPRYSKIWCLAITGGSCDQSLLPALFYALRQLPSLTDLRFLSFKEVETIPSELGTLIRLRSLEIRFCRKLRELPESLGLLKINKLLLEDLPRLHRLPESLGNIQTLLWLEIRDCGSLQSMPRSWGHRSCLERDQPMSRDDRCSTSDACPTLDHAFNDCDIGTNSWSVLRCLVECCNLGSCNKITFWLMCGTMQSVLKKAVEERTGGDLTVAMKFFRELCLEFYAGDDREHKIFSHSTSWPRFSNLRLRCRDWCSTCYDKVVCVRETDIEEDDDEDTEEESVQDEAEEATEDIEESAYQEGEDQ